MPEYIYVGADERVLLGLSNGVNATLTRAEIDPESGEPIEHGQPEGSTVVARTKDQVRTDQPYPHALMINTETGESDVEHASTPDTAQAPTAANAEAVGPAEVGNPGEGDDSGGPEHSQPAEVNTDGDGSVTAESSGDTPPRKAPAKKAASRKTTDQPTTTADVVTTDRGQEGND